AAGGVGGGDGGGAAGEGPFGRDGAAVDLPGDAGGGDGSEAEGLELEAERGVDEVGGAVGGVGDLERAVVDGAGSERGAGLGLPGPGAVFDGPVNGVGVVPGAELRGGFGGQPFPAHGLAVRRGAAAGEG